MTTFMVSRFMVSQLMVSRHTLLPTPAGPVAREVRS
jgi:hypothetical protein